ALQHHVDEVDDDDAAQVTQPELAHDLLGRLQVVAGDRLLQVAAGTGVLAGVDVDDGHRLGTVDHEAAARGQEHLAVQRLEQLLALHVRQLPAYPGRVAVRHVHQVPPGQRDVAGQAGTLGADRVLGDLYQHRVAGLESLLDRAGAPFQAGRVPVDLAGVQHGVAPAS